MAENLIEPSQIQGIVIDVFRFLVKLPVQPVAAASMEPSPGVRVTSSVTVSGPPGSIPACYGFALEMPEKLAFKIAAPLSATPIATWTPLVEDACGELVNMIGGNAKKHLIATYMLSLPTVVHGKDYHWSMPKLEVRQIESFLCGDSLIKLYIGEERSADH